MTNISARLFGLAIVAGMSFSACTKQGEDDILVQTSSTESKRMEDQFGEGFGKAYRADPNSEPVNVSEIKLPPVSYTTEPIPID